MKNKGKKFEIVLNSDFEWEFFFSLSTSSVRILSTFCALSSTPFFIGSEKTTLHFPICTKTNGSNLPNSHYSNKYYAFRTQTKINADKWICPIHGKCFSNDLRTNDARLFIWHVICLQGVFNKFKWLLSAMITIIMEKPCQIIRAHRSGLIEPSVNSIYVYVEFSFQSICYRVCQHGSWNPWMTKEISFCLWTSNEISTDWWTMHLSKRIEIKYRPLMLLQKGFWIWCAVCGFVI